MGTCGFCPREHWLLENHVSSDLIYLFHSYRKRYQTLLIFGQYLQAGWNGVLAFFATQCIGLLPLELEAQKAMGYVTVDVRIPVNCVMSSHGVQNWSSFRPAVHGI